jgi:hypothetical protein
MIKVITLGSDPEYFIRNKNTGMIVSSINIVEGTKEKPEPLGKGFSILKDNILVEGNIPPTDNSLTWIYNMKYLKQEINKYIQAKYPVLEVCHADCLEVNSAFLSHPEALQFGCSPYLNAWDDESHRANDLSGESFRTAGFHIHIGYTPEDNIIWSRETINTIIAKAFDFFVVIPSCYTQVDQRRFENYGGLGQYRDTSYGLECRSLGAYFVDDKYLGWVIDQTMKALTYICNEENFYQLVYTAKPTVLFEDGKFNFDPKIYDSLNIPFEEQLIKTNKTVYA